MKQLLKLEFRRLTRLKSFYICGGIMLGQVLLAAVITSFVNSLIHGIADYMGGSGVGGLLNGFNTSSFELLIAVFVALSVCEDFERKTIRVILSRGYSRRNVYFAKLASVLVMATAAYGAVLLVSFGINTMYFGVGYANTGKLLRVLGSQYIACLAEVTMFFAVSYLLRKNGTSIAITVVAPVVIPVILTLMDVSSGYGGTDLSDYWISGFLSDLSVIGVSSGRLTECLIGSVIYLLGFGGLGLLGAEKSEV